MERDILVVDDDPDIRAVIGTVLEEEGYHVVCAENGRRALDVLDGGYKPCLILLDLRMPTMSGWEFLDERRRRPALSEIPVAVLSAEADRLFPSGLPGDHCLHKPFDVQGLLHLADRYRLPS